MSHPRRILPKLAVLGAALLLPLLLAEGVLRWLDVPPPVRSGWLSDAAPFEKNELGYRGQPIDYGPDDYVIVLVGDSQVEAKACSYVYLPERRLQVHLSGITGRAVRVFSLGATGYGEDQELLALRRYFKRFRADRVVTWYTLNNDVKDNTWPTHMPIDGRPKPTFWIEEGELRGPNHVLGATLDPRFRLQALLQRALAGSPDGRWARMHLPAPYEALAPDAAGEPVRDDWQQLVAQGLLSVEGLRMEKSDWALRLDPVSPRTRYGVELTHRLLEATQALAASHDAGFTVFAVDKGDKGEEMDGVYAAGAELYRVSSARFWENIDRVTSGFDYHLIPVPGDDWQAGPYDHHLNEHATDRVMRELAAWMAEGIRNAAGQPEK